MEIIKLVQSISNPFLDLFFQLVTMMGEDTFFIFVTSVIYWCVDKELGYKLGFVTLTSATVNFGLKDMLKIPRPIGEEGIRSLRVHTAEGYSFPSGHTQNTATIWTFFMLLFRKGWLYAVGVLIILLVGVSRIYLGVHTPADVIGGILIGSVWVVLWGFIYETSMKRKDKKILVLAAVFATAGLLVFKEPNYYKCVGALTGLLIGYMAEQRFIKFKEHAGPAAQFIKVLSGMLVVYVLRIVLKVLLPAALISDYFRYMILLLWITTAAPLLFKILVKDYR